MSAPDNYPGTFQSHHVGGDIVRGQARLSSGTRLRLRQALEACTEDLYRELLAEQIVASEDEGRLEDRAVFLDLYFDGSCIGGTDEHRSVIESVMRFIRRELVQFAEANLIADCHLRWQEMTKGEKKRPVSRTGRG